jgi:integrase
MARLNGRDRGITERKGRKGWWVRLYANGQQRWYKCDTKSQAKALYGRLKAEIREGRYFPERYRPKAEMPLLLFGDYVKTWKMTLTTKGLKSSTIDAYNQRLQKRILPTFGTMPLVAIDRPAIKQWAAGLLGEGLDYDTVFNLVLTVSAILTDAVEDKLLPSNPALRAGKKILRRPKGLGDDRDQQELEIFTEEEERAILATSKSGGPMDYPLALTFLRAGLRHGEVAGLHRADLDLRQHVIHVRRQWSRRRIETPKNGKGRNVDMSKRLAAALKEWIAHQDLEAAASGRPTPEILFPGNTGGTRRIPSYLADNWLRYKFWHPLLKSAQVRRLDLHGARHTFASRLIANNENLKYVSEQLGHSSIQVTADIYGHLIPGGNRQAVDRLDRVETENWAGTVTETVTEPESIP